MSKGRSVFWLILILPLLLGHVAEAALSGKIMGTVESASTGRGVAGANVVLEGTRLGASTDLDGAFLILNIPPGVYTLRVSYVGFHEAEYRNVRVQTDRTTTLDIRLDEAVLEAEEVVYIVEREMIRRDATDTRTTRTAEDLEMLPVENVREVVRLTAGTVGNNFRGGRANEVSYLVDGVSFIDPMTGNNVSYLPSAAFEEVSIVTGGQSAEYGNFLSGVVSQVTREGGNDLSGSLTGRTNDMGGRQVFIGERDRMREVQGTLGGPIPFTIGDGNMRFFVAGQYFDTRGRLDNSDSTLTSAFGKFTYNITPQHRLSFSSTVSNAFYNSTYFTEDDMQLWSRNTVEDSLLEFEPDYLPDGSLDPLYPYLDENGQPWYLNGQLDTEDVNHNGYLDPGEDLDGDGVVDSEDLNHDFGLNSYRMYDHMPTIRHHTDMYSLKWNHAINSRTFYEISVSRFQTRMHYNVRENINEDMNGNGILDMERTYSSVNDIPADLLDQYGSVLRSNADGTQYWFDFNGSGAPEWEDLNGNGLWDWDVYGPGTDLFRDHNNNGYVDASENNPRDEWIPWEDLPFGNTKDNDDFFTYGAGTTYYRLRWNDDEKTTWTVKGSITSQVHRYHQLKAGFDFKFMDIFDHDVDMASGGNVYGQNFNSDPRVYGIWFEDKMEFEGMVLNAGLRVDIFDVNWDEYPSDLLDPVIDPVYGGEVKNPRSVDTKYYFGPRIGASFPITSRDLLSFNYTKNFQIPIMNFVFTNVNWDLSGAYTLIGNPDIDPERTTSYELSVRHLFTNDLMLTVSGFYKDITGLTDTRTVQYSVTDSYYLYINGDYGNVRGVELSLEKRFSNYYAFNINYTYSVGKGKSSSSRQNYDRAWANQIIPTTESYLDWDQTHTIYSNVQFMIPPGTDPWGISALNEISLSIIGRYGSGLPYTSPARTKDPPINDRRLRTPSASICVCRNV